MTEPTPNTDDERLVAYLDGELDDGAAVQVEQLLASTPDVRHKVERLSRTWDLLDLLPSPRVSQEFTNRTLTAIRSKHPDEADDEDSDEAASTNINVASLPRDATEKWRRWGIRALAFVGLAIVAALGFRSTYEIGSRHQEEMLRNYPVIRRLDEYREVRDVKFLKELHDGKMFRREGSEHGPENR